MEFDSAEALCEHALSIHGENSEPASLEEAADRRLLALVLSAKGDHENALENLTHASAPLQANNLEVRDVLHSLEASSIVILVGESTLIVKSFYKHKKICT